MNMKIKYNLGKYRENKDIIYNMIREYYNDLFIRILKKNNNVKWSMKVIYHII